MSDNLIGATTAIFIVSLSIAVDEIVDVAWSTRDGTAKAGTDYQSANGVVSFLPGETTKQIEVIVYGQNVSPTGDKNFFINLMPPTNAVLGTALIEAVIKVEDESGVPVTSVIVAQGKRGIKGDPGLSAYEQAVLMGYDGTLEDWMQEQADAAAAAQRASDYAANAAAAATKAENAATAASFLGNIFPTPEAGVDPVIGVGNGAYYNVRSPDDDSYLVEYQNVGGVPTPSGKSYPSGAALNAVKEAIIDPNTGFPSASKIKDASGLSQQEVNDLSLTPYHFGGIGDGLLHPLSERYTTLAEAKAVYPSAQSLDDSIDLCALEAFFDYCWANEGFIADITLKANINRPLDLGTVRTNSDFKTKIYNGHLDLSSSTTAEISHLMQINMRNVYFNGRISLNGTGGTVKDRKVVCGLLIGDRGDDGSSGRVHINEVYCGGLKYSGIILLNDSIFPMIDKVYAGWCGSAAHSNYTNTSDTHFANITEKLPDINGDYGQRSTVKVDSLPPIVEDNRFNVMAVFEGDESRPYRVTNINTTDNTITVYPLLDTTKTYTRVKYIYGGGLFWTGNNSGVGSFNHLQFIVCGVGFWGLSLYGGTINMLSTEYCGAGYSLGKPYEAVIAYEINNGYFETNLWDFVQQWGVDHSVHNLRQSNNFEFNKIVNLQTYKYQNRLADPDRFLNSSFTVHGKTYRMSETVQHWTGNALVDLSNPEDIYLRACWTNSTVSLSISDISKIDKFLSYSKTIMLTPRDSVSTGRIKISPPKDWKLNGGEVNAIITATNYIGNGAIINLDINTTTKNITVRSDLFTALTVASVAYDPPSLTASGTVGDSVTTTVTLSGATVGSVVQAAFSQYHANIEISAAVSAANTVTVKFKNTGAAAVDLASGTLTVKLI